VQISVDEMYDIFNMMSKIFGEDQRRPIERETDMKRTGLAHCLAAMMLAGLAGCKGQMPLHGHSATPAASGQAAINLQGNDTAAFFANPNTHAFYDLSVKTFAKGPKGVNFAVYQDQSYALFRALGASMGVPPAMMQDHLKLIPGQMVQIVTEDPGVLKDYDSFVTAMMGPP
jgi:hypothetical protein